MKTKQFILLTVSKNTNSFGLRNHVFLARDGYAFEAARSDGDYHRRQFEKGKLYDFVMEENKNFPDAGFPITIDDGFELVKRYDPDAPASVINEAFREHITRPV